MFDINCFAFGWCGAFAIVCLCDESYGGFIVCFLLALIQAICIWG